MNTCRHAESAFPPERRAESGGAEKRAEAGGAGEGAALFSCTGVFKSFGNLPVLSGVSLELKAGEFVSILGASGAGKTTLFNILAGLDSPDKGKVFLKGEDITGIPGKVSYMLQKDLLLDCRTTLDNIILPLLIRRVKKKAARLEAMPFLSSFGLAGAEKKYPFELSGGMRQRAALLRTCLLRNPVILLDEPFSALDDETRYNMHTLYKKIASQWRFSTLFITHNTAEARTLSDKIYLMKGGRLAQCPL